MVIVDPDLAVEGRILDTSVSGLSADDLESRL